MEYRKGRFLISTDRSKLNLELIHSFLEDSYWAKSIPKAMVLKSLKRSLCFGLYAGEKQIGFARVISDYATFAYLADVFVIKSHRGKGLSKWLMECILNHPDLQGLRRWILVTRDAHDLYRKYGFQSLKNPERFMEHHDPHVYSRLIKKVRMKSNK